MEIEKSDSVVAGDLGLINNGTQREIKKTPGAPSMQEKQKLILTSVVHTP